MSTDTAFSTHFLAEPLAAPLVGLRCWQIRDRSLTGVTCKVAWTPGVNEASCHPWRTAPTRTAWTWLSGPHAVQLGCHCGFYARTDGDNPEMQTGRVEGIVEGFGPTVVGERGFRSQRARIVALVCPGVEHDDWIRDPHLTAYLFRQHVRPNYPGIPVYGDVAEALAAHPLTPIDTSLLPAA